MWFTLLIQRVTAPKRESSISQASTSCFFALSKSRRSFLIPCTKRQKLFPILTGQVHVVDDVFVWKPAPAVGGQNTLRRDPNLFFFRQPVSQHFRFSQINGDIIVCAHISQQDDYVLHCGMYFVYKICNAIHGTMNIACEKDRKASPSCTCHTGKSSSPCLLLSIVLHFCFFRITVLRFLRIEYLHIIQAETSQPAENA